jgi:hypothetical protein
VSHFVSSCEATVLFSSQTKQEVGVSRIHRPVSTSIKAAGVVTDSATGLRALPLSAERCPCREEMPPSRTGVERTLLP